MIEKYCDFVRIFNADMTKVDTNPEVFRMGTLPYYGALVL